MQDYVYPSIFFAYFMFFIFLVGAIFFFFRSFQDGYWGDHSEDAKFRMLTDEDGNKHNSHSSEVIHGGSETTGRS